MSDAYVQVQPDANGKQLDTELVQTSVGAAINTQRVRTVGTTQDVLDQIYSLHTLEVANLRAIYANLQMAVTPALFPITLAEVAAGAVVINTNYIQGDVRRYGAKGDGVTDDTVALQAAFAQASANVPGIADVYIPRSSVRYLFSQTLTAQNSITIKGDGKYASFLRYSGTGTAITTGTVNQTNLQLNIVDFTLELTGNGAIGIDMSRMISSTVRSVRVASSSGTTQTGISANPTVNAWTPFFNVLMDVTCDSTATGITLNGTSTNLPNRWRVVAGTFLSCGNCIDIEAAKGVQIVAPYFDQQTLAGLKCGASADGVMMYEATMETAAGGFLLDINAATNRLTSIGHRIYAGLITNASNGIFGLRAFIMGQWDDGIQWTDATNSTVQTTLTTSSDTLTVPKPAAAVPAFNVGDTTNAVTNVTFGNLSIAVGVKFISNAAEIFPTVGTTPLHLGTFGAATLGLWTNDLQRLSISSAGAITFSNSAVVNGSATGGIGYGTGAGGTVTQATSRTTGVTLNRICGAITMFSAAGSATPATFTVTNSQVAATDTVICNQASGTNLYEFDVTAVAAGSFNITFFTTGGVATDAPVINFSVLKAVTA